MGRKTKFSEFLTRSKIPVDIENDIKYKRVKIKHGGVSQRDEEFGFNIGTKKQFILKKGQFILSKIDARYGAFGIANVSVDDAIITGNFWAYDVDYDKIDIDWFNQFTNSQDFYDLCERSSTGITHRKYLNESAFLSNEINLPLLEEQEISVKNIENLKGNGNLLTKELSTQLSLISQLRQAFLKEATQGKLVSNETSDGKTGAGLLGEIKTEKEKLIKEKKIKKGKPLLPISEEEIPFDIPENWVWCRLGEVCTKITDGFHNTPPKVSKGFPYIAATHVKSNEINWDGCFFVEEKFHRELFNKAYPKKGEVLIVNIGAGSGTPAIIDVDFEFSFKNTAILKFNLDLINNNLIFYFFILNKADIYANLTKGGLQPFLSLKILNDIIFPLPPLEIQNRIVSKLEELMTYCDDLETAVKESQNYNAQLLQQVLREALEVKEVAVK